MISLEAAVSVVIYVVVAAIIFGLLWLLVHFVGKLFPGEASATIVKVGQAILIILAILVAIGLLLSLVTGQPLFRTGKIP